MARALIPLVALALAGCMDFVEPQLPAATENGSLDVVVFQDETRTRVTALLVVGRAEGEPRDVVQPTLWVSGAAIEAAAGTDAAQRSYDETLVGRAPAALVVRIPEVSGVVVPDTYGFAQRERSGPRDVTVVRGKPLVLRFAPPAHAADPPAEHAWILVANGATTALHATGSTAPPDSVVIPATLLPPDGTLHVVLTEHQAREAADGDRFRVRVQLARRFVWAVQIVPAP